MPKLEKSNPKSKSKPKPKKSVFRPASIQYINDI